MIGDPCQLLILLLPFGNPIQKVLSLSTSRSTLCALASTSFRVSRIIQVASNLIELGKKLHKRHTGSRGQILRILSYVDSSLKSTFLCLSRSIGQVITNRPLGVEALR